MSDPPIMNGQLPNDLGWCSGYKRILGDIFGYCASGSHDCISADGDAGKYERPCTNPGIILNYNPLGGLTSVVQRVDPVIGTVEYACSRADHDVIANRHLYVSRNSYTSIDHDVIANG